MNGAVARLKRDEGFTLIELLLSIVILGVVVAAVGSAIIVGFTTTSGTSQRLSESHDAQIASAYLAKDVQNAISITSATTASCGPGALITFSNDGTNPAIAYYYGTSGGETQLTRTACDGSGAQVLAHFAGPGTPDVKCDGVACNPSVQRKPDIVKILVTESSGYSFSLVGARRATDRDPQPSAATVNVLVLAIGAGGSPGLDIGGQGHLTIKGSLYVNSNSPNAVSMGGCTASPCLNVTDTAKMLQGGQCSGCVNKTSPPYPSGWGSYPTIIPDPLRFLPYPAKPACPGPQCFTDGNYHGPGLYKTTLSISSSLTMQAGIYILERGMSISSNGTIVTGDAGVMLFNTCVNTGNCGGTDLGGQIGMSGHSGITLTPPTGVYDGIVIFQDRTNTQPMGLTGQSAVSSLRGTIYAPSSQLVTLSAGGAAMSLYSIVASNLRIAGGSAVSIGP